MIELGDQNGRVAVPDLARPASDRLLTRPSPLPSRRKADFMPLTDVCKFVDSLGPLSVSKDDAAVACAALQAEAIVFERERCARIAEDWLTAFANQSPAHIGAQKWASDAVRDITDAIINPKIT